MEKFRLGIVGRFNVHNAEEGIIVQRKLFEYGYSWPDGSKDTEFKYSIKTIHLEEDMTIGWTSTPNYENHPHEVVLDVYAFLNSKFKIYQPGEKKSDDRVKFKKGIKGRFVVKDFDESITVQNILLKMGYERASGKKTAIDIRGIRTLHLTPKLTYGYTNDETWIEDGEVTLDTEDFIKAHTFQVSEKEISINF